jgi:hypothetical protein
MGKSSVASAKARVVPPGKNAEAATATKLTSSKIAKRSHECEALATIAVTKLFM